MMPSYQPGRSFSHTYSNPGVGAMILAGFISGTCWPGVAAAADHLVGPEPQVREGIVYGKSLVAPSMPSAIGSVVRLNAPERAGDVARVDPLVQAVNNFYVQLEASQVALGDDFAEVLQDNFWDICVRV